jgi:hypothetical protein
VVATPGECRYIHCVNPIPKGRRGYCSDPCGNKERVRLHRQRNRDKEFGGKLRKVVTAAEAVDGRGSMRRGELYEKFRAAGFSALAKENGGRLTHQEIADLFKDTYDIEVSRVSVTHWLAADIEDRRNEVRQEQWAPGEEAKRATVDFEFFRSRYFTVARGPLKGKPPATAPFHLKWINAILDAIEHGGQLMILSPPRHGKSLLMSHFVIWQIVRNPDQAIVWVAGNENIARRFGSLVRDELESNAKLIRDFCGPTGSFKPSTRTGAQWRDDEFEVATRTTPQPAPTFKAVGRGGRLLSMDADLIVTDDIEDNKSTLQPGQRENTDDWFHTDLATRKEEHTAWVYIGSRQHPEDLAGKLLENDEWDTIVESAHDEDCGKPAGNIAAHTDCVLWPEVRTYKYLMQKKRTVGGAKYEMQFLNRPRSDGLVIFDRETVEGCLNRSRRIGDVPPGCRLIAGLDPASKQYQAAILWAVNLATGARYLVDLENEKAGSTPHLRRILADWHKRYRVTDWVIEDNIIDDVLAHDDKVLELRSSLGLRFIPHHTTGSNKWDARMGVTSMVPLFEQRLIDLPYAGEDTQGRVDVYVTQLVHFDGQPGGRSKWAKDDLVMAGWFPERTVKDWLRSKKASRAERKFRGTAFPGSAGGRAPWRKKAAA